MDCNIKTIVKQKEVHTLCSYLNYCLKIATPCDHTDISSNIKVCLSFLKILAQSLCILCSIVKVVQKIISKQNQTVIFRTPKIKYFQDCKINLDCVNVMTPTLNISTDNSRFKIFYFANASLSPTLDSWSIQASALVWVSKKTAQFHELSRSQFHAVISIPLYVHIEQDCTVEVYVSYTSLVEQTKWQQLNVCSIEVKDALVQFSIFQPAIYTVVVSKKRPSSSNIIYSSSEGSVVLQLDSTSEIKVRFPEEALFTSCINVNVECLYYDKFYVPEDIGKLKILAAPIIALSPVGSSFKKKVCVILPLPKANDVFHWNKNCTLTILYSQTGVNTIPNWKVLHTDYVIDFQNKTVTFYTSHFTLFSVFWNILDSALPEQFKLHATFNLPRFSFWVYFRALMTEYTNKKQFGICVVCYRFNDPSAHFSNQYPHEVGTCKPRKIRAGKLRIQLKSGLFNADHLAGESSLTKFVDFCGHDFDIHFACMFKSKEMLDVGLIGKVQVHNGDEELSFNLIKNSNQILKRTKAGNKLKLKEVNKEIHKNLMNLCRVRNWSKLIVNPGCTKTDTSKNVSDNIIMPVNSCFEHTSAINNSNFNKVLINSNSEIKETFEKKESRKRRFESDISSEKFSESKLDDIAGEVSKWWKSLGRKLNISENVLQEIDLNFRHCGEKEKAFQMLLTWREKDPENCTPKKLYNVLKSSGLKYTGTQCLT